MDISFEKQRFSIFKKMNFLFLATSIICPKSFVCFSCQVNTPVLLIRAMYCIIQWQYTLCSLQTDGCENVLICIITHELNKQHLVKKTQQFWIHKKTARS